MCENYTISQIFQNDTRRLAQIDELLLQEGLQRDRNLDYICGIFDEMEHLLATGSCRFIFRSGLL